MTRPALLALLLAAVLPLAGASCGDGLAARGSGPDATAASAGALAVRTDSLLISVDSLQFMVAIGYPQLTGATATVSAERVAAVNAAIRDSVAALAEQFRPEEAVAPEDRGSFSFVAEVEGGTDAVRLHGDVLSGLLQVYAFTGGAHGNTYVQPVNVDLVTGAPIRIGDLFRAGTPWADSLSAHASRALTAKLVANDPAATPSSVAETFYREGFDADAMRQARFTLGRDSLAVHFVPYEVAFYAFGSTRVPVAYADLVAFLRPNGPVARLRGGS